MPDCTRKNHWAVEIFPPKREGVKSLVTNILFFVLFPEFPKGKVYPSSLPELRYLSHVRRMMKATILKGIEDTFQTSRGDP